MTRRLRQNFSGMRATILQAADRNRTVLMETLTKLGLEVSPVDPAAEPNALKAALTRADIVFFDADIREAPQLPSGVDLAPMPLVVIIGLETPSRLQHAFELGPSAILHKPVRSSGVYSALFFAVNEHGRRAEALARLKGLEDRRGARRYVHKALLHLMRERDLDDEAAYALLRKESMRQRVSVEELAMRMLADPAPKRSGRKA